MLRFQILQSLIGLCTLVGVVSALPWSVNQKLAQLPEFVLLSDSLAVDLNRMHPLADTQNLNMGTGPLSPWHKAQWLSMKSWQLPDSLIVGVWLESRGSSLENDDPFLGITGSLDWLPRPDLRLHTVVSAMLNQRAPEEFRGNWGDVSAGSREAWLQWQRDWFQLKLGRMSLNTGPEVGRSLLLSNTNSLDGYRLELRPLRRPDGLWFSAFHFALNDRFDGSQKWARWLAGHRLGWTQAGHWSVAMGEAILYGREQGGASAAALNPFLAYHAVQMNGLEANTVFHLSGWWKFRQRYLLTAEFLLDDLQLDDSSVDDQEPNEWALQVDLRTALPQDVVIQLGWTQIAQRSYNSVLDHQKWLYRKRFLAHPLGADAQEFRFKLGWNHFPWFRPSYALTVQHKGERHPLIPFDEPWLEDDAAANYSESFPTGIVEKTIEHVLAIDAQWKNWSFRLALIIPTTENLAHVSGQDSNESYLTLSIFTGIPNLLN